MPTPGTGTIINGVIYQFACLEISLAGKPYGGITEINYSDTLEPGVLRGTSPYMRGRTLGQYEAEASFTMAKQDFELLKAALAGLGQGGFGEAVFLITVSYRVFGLPLITDTIEGCRIKHNENAHSSGNTDALLTKCDLSVFRIGWNGVYAIAPASGGGTVGGLIGA